MIRLIVFISLFFVFIPFSVDAQAKKLGKVTDPVLSEISGITTSANQRGYFWVHNDSGDKSQIYLIDSTARLQVTVKLGCVKLIDCEDISRVTYRDSSYLLLADMGNNVKNREELSLYLFPELQIDFKSKEITIPANRIKTIRFKYADKRRDAEAIFVDQQNQEVYIVSKRDFKSTVFSFPLADFGKKEVISLQPKMTLPFTFATSADMSLDGKHIIIKNLTEIFFWERNLNDSVLETLAKPYKNIPYIVEPQGEAICFDPTASYFYTISERPLSLDSYLYKYNY